MSTTHYIDLAAVLRLLAFISAGALLAVVVVFSVSSLSPGSMIWNRYLQGLIDYEWWGRVQHLLAYSLLMAWAAYLFFHKLHLSALLLIGLGGALELLQTFIPGRSVDFWDVLAGSAGVCLVWGLALVIRHIRT